MIAGDTDWVEDVRRWYFNGGRSVGIGAKAGESASGVVKAPVDAVDLGYEAAHPAVTSRSWSTTSPGELTECR